MSKESYPTGVENHGKSLRIWFILKVSVSGKTSVSLTPLKQEGGRGAENVSLFRYPHGDL